MALAPFAPMGFGTDLFDPFNVFGGVGGFGDIGNFGTPTWTTFGGRPRFEYPVDIEESDSTWDIYADAPGLKPDEVSIEVSDDRMLTIRGEPKEEEAKRRGFVRTERGRRRFLRSFVLPDGADMDNIRAHLEGGILKVSIPKRERKQMQTRRIPLSSAQGAGSAGTDIGVGRTGATGTA